MDKEIWWKLVGGSGFWFYHGFFVFLTHFSGVWKSMVKWHHGSCVKRLPPPTQKQNEIWRSCVRSFPKRMIAIEIDTSDSIQWMIHFQIQWSFWQSSCFMLFVCEANLQARDSNSRPSSPQPPKTNQGFWMIWLWPLLCQSKVHSFKLKLLITAQPWTKPGTKKDEPSQKHNEHCWWDELQCCWIWSN